jgi:hypothetical protein
VLDRGSDARWKEIAMAFTFLKDKAEEKQPVERPGDWYADPYGHAARRWFDAARGWTDRVQGAGQEPDKTGLPGIDEAATSDGSTGHVDADGKRAPLSRPVDIEMLGRA